MVARRTSIILVVLFLAACSPKACDELFLDTINYHDSAIYSKHKYFLYSRTTGWHEKVVFFELYKENPVFDECRHSNINPIFAIDYSDYPEMQYVKEMILQPDQPEKLKIIYTKDKNKGVANIYDVKFAR